MVSKAGVLLIGVVIALIAITGCTQPEAPAPVVTTVTTISTVEQTTIPTTIATTVPTMVEPVKLVTHRFGKFTMSIPEGYEVKYESAAELYSQPGHYEWRNAGGIGGIYTIQKGQDNFTIMENSQTSINVWMSVFGRVKANYNESRFETLIDANGYEVEKCVGFGGQTPPNTKDSKNYGVQNAAQNYDKPVPTQVSGVDDHYTEYVAHLPDVVGIVPRIQIKDTVLSEETFDAMVKTIKYDEE